MISQVRLTPSLVVSDLVCSTDVTTSAYISQIALSGGDWESVLNGSNDDAGVSLLFFGPVPDDQPAVFSGSGSP